MLQHSALQLRRAALWTIAGTFALLTVIPALLPSMASAAPAITERELQSSSARPGVATNLTWIFDTTADAANIDQIEIEFCDTPLSTCSNVSGTTNIPTLPGSPTATLTNFTSTGNTASTGNGDGGGTNNQITIDKTTADAGASLNEATIAINGFTNNATANKSYYTRMRLYSDTGTTLVWEGVFAQSTSQTLTVNARVQERLDFCVGSTTANSDAATAVIPGDCSTISGSNVDIGNIESGFTNISPVSAGNGGDGENGLAMVRTNAVNGVVIDYKAIQNSASGSLKVAGSTCGSTVIVTGAATDQCFNSNGTTAVDIDAGVEAFGMVVAGINCESTTAYTCNFGTGAYNLVRDPEYDGAAAPNNTFVTEADQDTGDTVGEYAWDDTGAADRIASSAGSSVKVVDDEAMILKFAATAGITTPTGSYTVQADYIATATF